MRVDWSDNLELRPGESVPTAFERRNKTAALLVSIAAAIFAAGAAVGWLLHP